MCNDFFNASYGPNTNSFPNYGKELSRNFFLLIKKVKNKQAIDF